ncbi:MAG TPA: hypothetical protein VGU01_08440 [Sphingomicrobium sp.]|nr:hypothetical protein [Sphingomicrobium sp.]
MIMQLAITVGAWVVLMFVTTNIVGFLVRGFFQNPEMERLATESNPVIQGLARSQQRTQKRLNVVAFALMVGFLLALYQFWNVGLVIAALLMIGSRIPDLVWELTNGTKVIGNLRKPPFWILSTLLSWASLPVVWYALNRM